MPPAYRFTRDEIAQAALQLVRQSGTQAVTARAVGAALHSSAKIVFGSFRNMEELQLEVRARVEDVYAGFLEREMQSGEFPPYKALGMGYIRFAQEERELFRLLFMGDRSKGEQRPGKDTELSVELIRKGSGLPEEKARLLHLEMWTCVHGVAVMLATRFCTLDRELISRILTDVYQGVRARFMDGEEKTCRRSEPKT